MFKTPLINYSKNTQVSVSFIGNENYLILKS